MPKRVRLDSETTEARTVTSNQIDPIVEIALSSWHNIMPVLSPIIGERGVEALFRRSLQQGLATNAACLTDDQSHGSITALEAALRRLTPETASAANAAVLSAFVDLLSNLIGAALTAHLIGFAYHPPSGGDPARDS